MGGRIIRMPEGDEPKLMYPRVGTIHVGMKNEKGFPQSVDYFIPKADTQACLRKLMEISRIRYR